MEEILRSDRPRELQVPQPVVRQADRLPADHGRARRQARQGHTRDNETDQVGARREVRLPAAV